MTMKTRKSLNGRLSRLKSMRRELAELYNPAADYSREIAELTARIIPMKKERDATAPDVSTYHSDRLTPFDPSRGGFWV